jgi:hypothetical protein
MMFDSMSWTFHDSIQENLTIVTSKRFNDVLGLIVDDLERLFSFSYPVMDVVAQEQLSFNPDKDYNNLALSKITKPKMLDTQVRTESITKNVAAINQDALYDQFIQTTSQMTFKHFELKDHIITSHALEQA